MFELIKDIWNLFLELIGFLFDIDFSDSDKEHEDPFANVADAQTDSRLFDPNKVYKSEEIAVLTSAFGRDTAEYITDLREQVDTLVQENTLEYVDSVYVILPPEKFSGATNSAAVIDNIIESVYSQLDGDFILKPGKINVFVTEGGLKYAEIYIDQYKPTEEFIMS